MPRKKENDLPARKAEPEIPTARATAIVVAIVLQFCFQSWTCVIIMIWNILIEVAITEA